MSEMKQSPYAVLAAIDCSQHTEEKGGLTYLSWAWAWGMLKAVYPMSYYTIYEDSNGRPYHTDGRTCWVKTGVTLVDGETALEHIEYLPVMDFKNRSIAANAITSMDVNKAVQRSLTKAVARHGLGLNIYAGEDLPMAATPEEREEAMRDKAKAAKAKGAPEYKDSAFTTHEINF